MLYTAVLDALASGGKDGADEPFERHPPCEQSAHLPSKLRVTIPVASANATGGGPSSTGACDSWRCEGIGMQPITDVPEEWRGVLSHAADAAADFYSTRYVGNSGVWYAVLFALDPQFVLRTFASQHKCVVQLKHRMNDELDVYYERHKYRQYGFAKADLHRLLMHADDYNAVVGHYLCDFFDVNVVVLSPPDRYYWLGRLEPARVTIALHHHGNEWCPIVHADQRSHAFRELDWLQGLEHLESMDRSTLHQHMEFDKRTVALLRREIRAMKIRELQDRAASLEILIYDDGGKKKLKSVLQDEVLAQMTGGCGAAGDGGAPAEE